MKMLLDNEAVAAIEKGLSRFDAVEVKQAGGKVVVVGIDRKVTHKG